MSGVTAMTDVVAIASATSAAVPANTIRASPLRTFERSWIPQVLLPHRRGRPEGKRAQRSGRVVAGVLRIGTCTHHEQIWHIPALQIAIDCTCARIGPHDGAAA